MGLIAAFVSFGIIVTLNCMAGLYGLIKLKDTLHDFYEPPGTLEVIDFILRGVFFLLCILLLKDFSPALPHADIVDVVRYHIPGLIFFIGGVTVLFMSLLVNVGQSIYLLTLGSMRDLHFDE